MPKRDSLDARIIEEVKTGTAHYGKTYSGGGKGIIDSQTDVGGWPVLNSSAAPADSDHDGMADNWETANKLNPNDPADRNLTGADGYTMLEIYLNSMAQNITGIREHIQEIPAEFQLLPNYPNPFNPETVIRYSIPAEGNIEINVYDINGRLVRCLSNNSVQAGNYRIIWNGTDENGNNVSSGIYLCLVDYNSLIKTQKLVLIK